MSEQQQQAEQEVIPPKAPRKRRVGRDIVPTPEPAPTATLYREMVDDAIEQREQLKRYIHAVMVKGTDYGRIPGVSSDRDVLFKPGAEKLVDIFRCAPEYVFERNEEDRATGYCNYQVRCEIRLRRDPSIKIAEGIGSANADEPKYRWRHAKRICPSCKKETIGASRLAHRPGFFCNPRKGGCGAEFGPADQRVTSQVIGLVENEGRAELWNTILKMAKKRALVDGALALGRCSDLFTQDLDDGETPIVPPETPASPPPPPPPPAASNGTRTTQGRLDDVLAQGSSAAQRARAAPPAGPQYLLVPLDGDAKIYASPRVYLDNLGHQLQQAEDQEIARVWDDNADETQRVYDVGDRDMCRRIDTMYVSVQPYCPSSTPPYKGKRAGAAA